VQDYLIAQLDKILSENNITFIKWDMNRNVSEPGWSDAPSDARELWVRYVRGVYRVWQTLKDRHPNVIWQSCSGGGGRADMGILKLADQIWVSDNTDAHARLSIQEGFSQVFPANTMEAWVTDGWHGTTPPPLEFRFHVSMCGTLGVGSHLLKWTDEERALAAKLIADYKTIRHIVQLGDLYRLRSPQQEAVSAVQYVSKDKAESVVFTFRTFLPEPAQLPALYLKGLDAAAIYENAATGERKSGAGWMYAGLPVQLRNLQSAMLHLKRV
jgi:alpha-galactosidase